MTYAFHTPDKLCFILDLMNGGDLHYHLSQHGVFNEQEMRFYAAEVILGATYMHNTYHTIPNDTDPAIGCVARFLIISSRLWSHSTCSFRKYLCGPIAHVHFEKTETLLCKLTRDTSRAKCTPADNIFRTNVLRGENFLHLGS